MKTSSKIKNNKLPPISIIMPIYNEAEFITMSLNALLNQDYKGPVEILCIDGMSNDGTRNIIRTIIKKNHNIKIIDNPFRIIPKALNMGIREAKHEYIARMDAHSMADPHYLTKCTEVLKNTNADCVGGRWIYKGSNFISSAIAAAMDSKFGVGTAKWRGTTSAGNADTVPFGFWKRELLLDMGGFNETLLCNEDYEFNYRLRMAGGRIYYSPDIISTYYVRKNLYLLWKQYFKYGFWKPRILQMHPASLRLRHSIAPLFTVGLLFGPIISLFSINFLKLYCTGLILYFILLFLFSLLQSVRHGWKYLPMILPAFVILHTAWGTGFLTGIFRWWILKGYRDE